MVTFRPPSGRDGSLLFYSGTKFPGNNHAPSGRRFLTGNRFQGLKSLATSVRPPGEEWNHAKLRSSGRRPPPCPALANRDIIRDSPKIWLGGSLVLPRYPGWRTIDPHPNPLPEGEGLFFGT